MNKKYWKTQIVAFQIKSLIFREKNLLVFYVTKLEFCKFIRDIFSDLSYYYHCNYEQHYYYCIKKFEHILRMSINKRTKLGIITLKIFL